MLKKWYFVVSVLVFTFSLLTSPSLFAGESKTGDISDISLDELLNVEITTAGKQAEKISEIPASVVLVTREDIEKYGYQSLPEILQNIPGLYMTDDYLSQNIGTRGFWSPRANRNMIILVNDVPQIDDVFSDNHLEAIPIPPEAIDRIEVVRGPMSVIYGTGAFFGVINIKTNIVDEKHPANLVSVSYGSENTKKLTLRASGKQGNFQYAFTGYYGDTDGIDVPYTDMMSQANLTAWGVPTGKTTKDLLGNTEKYLNFSGSFKDFYIDFSYADDQKGVMFVFPSVSDGQMSTLKWTRVYFGYKKKFSEKLTLDAKLGINEDDWKLTPDWLFPGYYGIEHDGSTSYKAEANIFYTPNSKINFSAGVNYYKVLDAHIWYTHPLFGAGLTNLTQELTDKSGNSILTQSIFANLSYAITEKLKFVAGARVEQVPEYDMDEKIAEGTDDSDTLYAKYSHTAASFVPRLAVIYSINNNNVIKALYGEAVNNPSLFMNADQRFNSPKFPSLKPEHIKTLELNYMGNFGSKLSVSLSIFRNMLDKLIFRTFTIDGLIISKNQANVGEMTTNGAELTITTVPVDKLHIEVSGTYQKTKDKRYPNIVPGYSPKFLGYLKAYYSFNKDVSLAITGSYVDKMETYYNDTLEPPARIGEPVDSYFLFGANFRAKNLFGTGMYLNIRGSNLFDTKVFYPTTANNNNYSNKGTEGRGISCLFTLGYSF